MTCKYYKVIELHGVLQSEICTYGTDDGDYSECVSCQSQEECSRFYAGLMQAVMKRMRTEQMKYMGSKAIEKKNCSDVKVFYQSCMPQFWSGWLHTNMTSKTPISVHCVLLLIVCTFSWFDCFFN